jgi:hypothetical protein
VLADASKTLRGFDLIDDIKAELEKKCKGAVSCADILTAAASDASIFVFWNKGVHYCWFLQCSYQTFPPLHRLLSR